MSAIALAVDNAVAAKAAAQDTSTTTTGKAKDFAGPLTFEAIMEIKKKSRVDSKGPSPNALPAPVKVTPLAAPAVAQKAIALTNPLIPSGPSHSLKSRELPALPHRIKAPTQVTAQTETSPDSPGLKSNQGAVVIPTTPMTDVCPPKSAPTPNLPFAPSTKSNSPCDEGEVKPKHMETVRPISTVEEAKTESPIILMDTPIDSEEKPERISSESVKEIFDCQAIPQEETTHNGEDNLPSHEDRTVQKSSITNPEPLPTLAPSPEVLPDQTPALSQPASQKVVNAVPTKPAVDESRKNVDAVITTARCDSAPINSPPLGAIATATSIDGDAKTNPLIEKPKSVAGMQTAVALAKENLPKPKSLDTTSSTTVKKDLPEQTRGVLAKNTNVVASGPLKKMTVNPSLNRAVREQAKKAAVATHKAGAEVSTGVSNHIEKAKPASRIRGPSSSKETRAATVPGPFTKSTTTNIGRMQNASNVVVPAEAIQVATSEPSHMKAGETTSKAVPKVETAAAVSVAEPVELQRSELKVMEIETPRVSDAAASARSSIEAHLTSPGETSSEMLFRALKGIGSEVMLAEMMKAQLGIGSFDPTNGVHQLPSSQSSQTPLRMLPHPAYVMPVFAPPSVPPSNTVVPQAEPVDDAEVLRLQKAASAAWKERVENVSYESMDTLVRDLERISASELAKLPSDEQSVVLEHRDRLLKSLLDNLCGTL